MPKEGKYNSMNQDGKGRPLVKPPYALAMDLVTRGSDRDGAIEAIEKLFYLGGPPVEVSSN